MVCGVVSFVDVTPHKYCVFERHFATSMYGVCDVLFCTNIYMLRREIKWSMCTVFWRYRYVIHCIILHMRTWIQLWRSDILGYVLGIHKQFQKRIVLVINSDVIIPLDVLILYSDFSCFCYICIYKPEYMFICPTLVWTNEIKCKWSTNSEIKIIELVVHFSVSEIVYE